MGLCGTEQKQAAKKYQGYFKNPGKKTMADYIIHSLSVNFKERGELA